MQRKQIEEFQASQKIEGFFLVKSIERKLTSTNKNYLDITLADKTGEINAKIWDCNEDDEHKYPNNSLIKVRGEINEWQGKLQLKINKIRIAKENDNVEIEDFIPSAPEKGEKMLELIFEYVENFKNEDIKNIVKYILNENKEKLIYYPAAKSNHHSIRAGLLYHVKRMLLTAERLCEVYSNINKDLLIAGVILHDIAKVDEMDSNELGIVSDYTREGKLLGHIIQGIVNINRAAKQVNADEEISLVLQHMILSHHYEPEFGSPRKPMIPEGELLHYIDMIDARMYDMEKALRKIEPGEFSERIFTLDRRQLYNPKFNKNDDDYIESDESEEGFVIDKEELLKKINEVKKNI